MKAGCHWCIRLLLSLFFNRSKKEVWFFWLRPQPQSPHQETTSLGTRLNLAYFQPEGTKRVGLEDKHLDPPMA
jgi:hypothetical protein